MTKDLIPWARFLTFENHSEEAVIKMKENFDKSLIVNNLKIVEKMQCTKTEDRYIYHAMLEKGI